MNAISSFREEWPENPSIERNCILIGTVSSLPFTLNVASFIPCWSCRPSPPGGW